MYLIKNFIANALINGLILYLIAKYTPNWGFHGFAIEPLSKLTVELTLVIWFIFYLVYSVLRRILNLITLPARWLSFGLFSVLINISMFMLFKSVINNMDLGVSISLWTLPQLIILSIIIYFFNLLLNKNV